MLSPDARSVAIEILRAPPGYRLDTAVLTTYSLDLEVLLALPLAVLAEADGGVEELLGEPLHLLEALREATSRVQVFVDAAGMAIPRVPRNLYAALEPSIHPVRAPGGGAFHPKVWVVRFLPNSDGPPLIRVSVASRNLTYDRSWDVALVSTATPGDRVVDGSDELKAFLRRLPGLSEQALPAELQSTLATLAEDVGHTEFPAPEGFKGALRFHALGLSDKTNGLLWEPMKRARRILAVAPFVGRGALYALAKTGAREKILVGRPDALDALPDTALEGWNDIRVLIESDLEEPEDDIAGRPSGLHAKLMVFEHGYRARWFVGSANLTPAAFRGSNVEVMAEAEGAKGYGESTRGVGIDRFLHQGFANLCMPYTRSEGATDTAEQQLARRNLQTMQHAILEAPLTVDCTEQESGWQLKLAGQIPESGDVVIAVWPVTVAAEQCRELAAALSPAPSWILPVERLTTFIAFRLSVDADVDDVTFVRKLPARGIPDGRLQRILRTLIDTPERFLEFLRALLGGLEGLVDWTGSGDAADRPFAWSSSLSEQAVLEDLLRAASRDPDRLDPVRRLMQDLAADDEGQSIVPEELRRIWQAIDAALEQHRR